MSSPALAKAARGRGRGQGGAPQRTNTMPSNMMTVLSRIKVDIPLNSGRGSKWGRRRPGSSRYSFMSSTSQDSGTAKPGYVDLEEEFLHAAEFGDIPNVKRILNDCVDLNIDCIDALGRTALRLAVKNEHLEVVEVLLEKSNQHHIYEAVLQAISAGHTQIAETILKHRRYLEMWKERRKLGDTDGFYKTAFPDSQFSPDITPLILSSQKNQYEIVQLLLLRGETITKPHKFSCGCQECRNRMKFDQLRLAKYRLNAYRGLASEAYISLSSKDPILTAFELAAELRRLSRVEKHFKREYRDLADQLSDYVVKLLDRIRTQKELELVLNKTGKPHQEKFESLARFKLALKYKEKKFIAHPSCQQRVVRLWYNGMGKLERAGWPKRLTMISLFSCAYPFLVFLHIICPDCKPAKVLQFPVVKFLCNAMSFMAFLLLIVVSTIESSQSVSKYRTLRSEYKDHWEVYRQYQEEYNDTVYGPDFPLRPSFPSITEMLMSLWIIGMLCQECNQLFHNGLMEHMLDLYNLLDVVLIGMYIATFSLRYWIMYKFHTSLDFIGDARNIKDEMGMFKSLYWLNA
ncbi:short transient receptor potential channel 7-like, partial [Physella acuta]|uniref:short transient receptor potential channel 7-like n=1 Tax=Physella acuta TaxID=109671 RepID=UPI0027DCA6F2